MTTWDISQYEILMSKTFAIFLQNLSTFRTGRANVALLESIPVEISGQKMRLIQLAMVNVVDSSTLTVRPYDSSMMSVIDKSIQIANLGVNSTLDVDFIRIKIPKTTEESRKDLVKAARKISDTAKISVRNIRRDAISNLRALEKSSAISEDINRKHLDAVQKITDVFIGKIDDAITSKEREIMEV